MKYEEMLNSISNTPYGKESRQLHKALKKYGDGLPAYRRYPYLAYQIISISLLLKILALIISSFK